MILYALFTCALVQGRPGTDCRPFGGSMLGTAANPAQTVEDCLRLKDNFLATLRQQGKPADPELSSELVCRKKVLPDWEPIK